MANITDASVHSVRGMDPQNLIEKIMRNRIYSCMYWKEQCFGLTAETLVDKAVELSHIGGTYGGNQQPTPFLCLLLKMLQLQPELEIVLEFIRNEDYKYITALGCLYLRLTSNPVDIYKTLEPLYNDYRKLRLRKTMEWEIMHVDEFIDTLLNDEYFCDIALPRIPDRVHFEHRKLSDPRKSVLGDL